MCLAAVVFALAGITALVAVWHANRWRAIKLAGGVFVLSSILTITARAWPAAAWLDHLSSWRLRAAEADLGRLAGRGAFPALRRHAGAGGPALLRPGGRDLRPPQFAGGDVMFARSRQFLCLDLAGLPWGDSLLGFSHRGRSRSASRP